jgi:molecular chaperone HtpG
VLIVENTPELLPRYLRFVKGVVDAADLPLNVSRQMLQHTHHVAGIRKWLSRKITETLGKLREKDAAKYLAFWREFGRTLKEGISEDHENRDRLTPLMLFESSNDAAALTSLSEYVSRMKPDQKEVYYLAGESRAAVERSPHLEEFRARGYEVLYLVDPVDELLVQSLPEFEGRRLKSVGKGQIDLGDDAERERINQEVTKQAEHMGAMLDVIAKHLEAHVRGVRLSKRLTVSPACLTGEEFAYSPHIERLLHKGKGGVLQRRTLELNGKHSIVLRMHERFTANGADPSVAAAADLLFGLALLAEGSELPDPVAFNARVTEILQTSLDVAGA